MSGAGEPLIAPAGVVAGLFPGHGALHVGRDPRHRGLELRERALALAVAARVSVDGTARGVTPLTVRLPSGAHVLEVQVGKSEPRVIPLTIQAGVQTAQYVELQGATVTGAVEI